MASLQEQFKVPLAKLTELLGLAQTGLVLRSQSVQACQAQRDLRGVQISQLHSASFARDEDVAPTILRALSDAQIAGSRMAVSVASPDVLLRSFTLPPLPKAEWSAAVQFEARKHIPFRPEDLVWDFHATEQRTTKQLDVIFVAIRSETFGKILGWLRAAQIEPTVIEPQSVSLARWMVYSEKTFAGQYWCLVDVEPHGAHIVIAKDQVPYFTRDVRFDSSAELPAGGAPDARADVLMSELRLSLDFFMREHPAASVGRIWLFGDEGTVGTWCPWLAKQLSAPVEMARLPSMGLGRFTSLRFGCAAGLMFRQLPAARVHLNFASRVAASPSVVSMVRAPSRLALPKELQPILRPLIAQAMVALIFLGALNLITGRRVEAVRQQQQRAVRNFTDAGWRLAGKNQKALEGLQKEADRRLSFLKKTVGGRVLVAEQLDALARTLPDGIWLEGLNFTNRSEVERGLAQAKLTIQGACYLKNPEKELGAIREFAHRLKEQAAFADDFSTAEVGEIMSATDRATQVPYKRFRLDCGIANR
jgi:Tfp pilus assembly PilM family ATPase